MIVTEKIDGTNGQICIEDLEGYTPEIVGGHVYSKDGLAIWAGSRSRWLTPEADNFGFAKWAKEHGEELLGLGIGRHYGEWWGSGINRGYGLPKGEKRFSLFNTVRWCLHDQEPQPIPTQDPRVTKTQDRLPACCGLVPVLYRGNFDLEEVDFCMDLLEREGSQASPGFKNPEGVVVFHVAANMAFKKTIGNDGHKGG